MIRVPVKEHPHINHLIYMPFIFHKVYLSPMEIG
ncbi:hypothetical protein WP5S18E01_38370 [Enterobacter cloacae]|nr:hypothetical protein WP5S18E01_38370 [Enterobacter cloacae]